MSLIPTATPKPIRLLPKFLPGFRVGPVFVENRILRMARAGSAPMRASASVIPNDWEESLKTNKNVPNFAFSNHKPAKN